MSDTGQEGTDLTVREQAAVFKKFLSTTEIHNLMDSILPDDAENGLTLAMCQNVLLSIGVNTFCVLLSQGVTINYICKRLKLKEGVFNAWAFVEDGDRAIKINKAMNSFYMQDAIKARGDLLKADDSVEIDENGNMLAKDSKILGLKRLIIKDIEEAVLGDAKAKAAPASAKIIIGMPSASGVK